VLGLVLSIVVGGLIIGGLARLAVPGPDPMPWWGTILVGWIGSAVGGIVARVFLGTTGGIVFALLGAVALVVLYRTAIQRRPVWGPGARRRR
jgi:uncharacterized membrane protein YeaQ/YmgE (transglycosylase-associated protein family)